MARSYGFSVLIKLLLRSSSDLMRTTGTHLPREFQDDIREGDVYGM
jgi:hypothetical protein